AHAPQPEHGVLPIGPKAGAQFLKRVVEIEIVGPQREQDAKAERAILQGAERIDERRAFFFGSLDQQFLELIDDQKRLCLLAVEIATQGEGALAEIGNIKPAAQL